MDPLSFFLCGIGIVVLFAALYILLTPNSKEKRDEQKKTGY